MSTSATVSGAAPGAPVSEPALGGASPTQTRRIGIRRSGGIAFTPDGETLVAITGQELRVWRAEARTENTSPTTHAQGNIR